MQRAISDTGAEGRPRRDRRGGKAEVRGRLVAAAEACVGRYGVRKTTVDDIARAAGVSKRTVYHYFAGRDAVLLEVFVAQLGALVAEIRERLDRAPTLADGIVDALLAALAAVRGGRHLAPFFDPEGMSFSASRVGTSEAVLVESAAVIGPHLAAARDRGELRPELDVVATVEFLLRIVLSLLTVGPPVGADGEAERHFLRTFVLPAIVLDPPPPEYEALAFRRDPSSGDR